MRPLVLLCALALAGCVAPGERAVLQVSPGYDLQRLTSTPDIHEGQPSLSADGTVVAFTRFAGQESEVWALRLGGQPVRLSLGATDHDHAPTVSGDGAVVAWVSVADGDSEIVASLPDGTGHHAITSNQDRDADPALSPDGQHVAYATNRWGNPEVVLARTDGSSERRLTRNEVPEFQVGFSGDGAKLTFIGYPEESEVYVINADASGLLRLTENGETDAYPTLDGAGARVAYAAGLEGEREIYVQDVGRGGAVRQLTDNSWDEWTPRLTSDGQGVVFRSEGARGASEHLIVMMDADGTGMVPLARGQDFAMGRDARRIVVVAQDDLWLLTRR